MNNSFSFQGDVNRSLNRYESPEQTDQGSTTLYRLFRYTGQYRFNAMFTSLRFGPYTILAWTAQSVNCRIALKAIVYLLNIAFINIVFYRNVIIHKRTHTRNLHMLETLNTLKYKRNGTYKLQNSHNGHM